MGVIRENENFINDDRLCFLFSLLINKVAIFKDISRAQVESFKDDFKVFIDEIAETYSQTLPEEEQEQILDLIEDYDGLVPLDYQDWYYVKHQDNENVVIITLKNNGIPLRNTLERYAQKHWENDLEIWFNAEKSSSEQICNDFYDEILDYNCKYYYTNKVENINAIVLGYFKGYICIENIECDIDLSPISDMLFMPCSFGYSTDLVSHFECCINAEKFKIEFNQMLADSQLNAKKKLQNLNLSNKNYMIL